MNMLKAWSNGADGARMGAAAQTMSSERGVNNERLLRIQRSNLQRMHANMFECISENICM